MLVILIVFFILSIINIVIFLAEDFHHRKVLQKEGKGYYDLLSRDHKPIVLTTIRDGRMQDTYIFLHQEKEKNSAYVTQTQKPVLDNLLLHSNIFMN